MAALTERAQGEVNASHNRFPAVAASATGSGNPQSHLESELPAQKEVTNDIQEFPDRSAHHRANSYRADFVGSHLDSQVGVANGRKTGTGNQGPDSLGLLGDCDSQHRDNGVSTGDSEPTASGKVDETTKIKTDDSAAVRGSSRALRRVDDLGDDDAVGMPHVAMSTATRGKSEKVKPRVKSTIKHATRGKSALPPKVEDVKASKGTWAFRLRWNSLPGRPVIYVSRVADSTYELIKKGNYEDFKQQLISSYIESAIRASNKA